MFPCLTFKGTRNQINRFPLCSES